MMPVKKLTALVLGCSVFAVAQAGLFDDDEARRAILDLRTRLSQAEDAQKASATKSDDQAQAIKRSLLDLNTQLEASRAEVAKLRGQNEQLARDVAEMQRKQIDLVQAQESRIRKLEPQKITIDGKEFVVDAEEKRQYDAAMQVFRAGEYAEAATSMQAFLKRFPNSGFDDSVRFWLGNAQYVRKDFKEAIVTFRAFIAAAESNPRVPEAKLAIANCQMELKDFKTAKRTLEELIKAHPNSEAAAAAKGRLVSMKS